MKRAAQAFVFIACAFFTVTGLYNVLSDNIEVVRMATELACKDEKPKCTGQMTRMERNPIAQTFEISTPKRRVDIRCTRAFYLVGDYACTLR